MSSTGTNPQRPPAMPSARWDLKGSPTRGPICPPSNHPVGMQINQESRLNVGV